MSGPALRVWIVLAAGVLGYTGCGEPAHDDPGTALAAAPDVILISIDSLRADHMGAYGYERETTPFLDQLAREGVIFENAISTTSWTLPAHVALFTGLLDSTHGVVDNGLRLADAHQTLAEQMHALGRHTAGFFGGPYLHPAFGVGQGFDVYQSCMGDALSQAPASELQRGSRATGELSHRDVTGPRTRDAIRRWAASRPPGPFFLFVHLWDVHYDYVAPAEYAARFTDPDYRGPVDGRLMANAAIRPGLSEADRAHLIGLYDAEIRFTDDILRGIFEDLHELGVGSDALVIVVADHGEEFFEHGGKGHNQSLFDEVLRVPMILRWPGVVRPGGVIEDQVQLVDVLPTLLRAAGFEGELTVQGRDLGPLLRGDTLPPRDALAELMLDGRSQRALRSNTRKVLRVRDDLPAFLFDLEQNPQERTSDAIGPSNVQRQDERLRAERDLESALQSARDLRARLVGASPEPVELDPSLADELRELGYMPEQKSER